MAPLLHDGSSLSCPSFYKINSFGHFQCFPFSLLGLDSVSRGQDLKSSAKTDENERETRLTLNKLPVLSISAAPVTAGHHVDPGWLSHLHSEQSLDYATIYLCHILNDGKNGFPVLCTVPRRVQKIKFKRTSGNKRKLSNVKDYLHIFCRGKDVEKGKQEKS